MNIQTPGLAIRTVDDFLAWNEGREGRREFVDGRIVEMMTGVTKNHWKLANRLSQSLGALLDDSVYDFGTADFGVRTSRGIRYPDFLVERSGGSGRELATATPILVAEILSPSSMALDFGPKAAEYTALPSLQHYLVLAQDEPRAWIWNRGEDGFGVPEMIEGAEGAIALAAFDLSLPLADLYRGIA